jgi:hypothetical protein
MSGVSNTTQATDAGFLAMAGGWAAAFAPPMIVYRLSPTTPSAGILNDTPVLPSFGAELKRLAKTDLENETFGIIAFDATCDNTQLILGDILQESGYLSRGTVYCFAQYREYEPTVFIRCETTAIVKRPTDVNAGAPGPQSTWEAVTSLNAEVTESSAYVATLYAGSFGFAPSGSSPVVIPMGLQPTTRISGTHPEAVPTSTSDQRYACYLPPCPGLQMRVNDEIEDQDGTGSVYVVQEVYSSGQTGLQGFVMLCTRQGA